jgi:MFS superfamily sulfate permease-like transporter
VADQAGAKSQLTGLFAALLVLAMLVLAPGLVQWLPVPVLAAVIIVAGASLLDVPALRRLWVVRRSDFAIAALCFLGVALVGVLEGIVVAVLVSVASIFMRAWRPYWAVLGEPDDVAGFHDVSRYPDAERVPGLVILRWDAPLFFANSNLFRDAVRHVVATTEPRPRWVIVAAEPITDIDTTAADMLVKLDEELNADGRHLVFAELKDPVREKLERYSIYETIDPAHFFPTIRKAVQAFTDEHPEVSDGLTGPAVAESDAR